MCTTWVPPCATWRGGPKQSPAAGAGGVNNGAQALKAWQLPLGLQPFQAAGRAPPTPSARSSSSRWSAAIMRLSRSVTRPSAVAGSCWLLHLPLTNNAQMHRCHHLLVKYCWSTQECKTLCLSCCTAAVLHVTAAIATDSLAHLLVLSSCMQASHCIQLCDNGKTAHHSKSSHHMGT